MSDIPAGETPPEPEEEGFREQVIEDEKARKLRAVEALDERSVEAKKRYAGVAELGDRPGSANEDRDAERDAARQDQDQDAATA